MMVGYRETPRAIGTRAAARRLLEALGRKETALPPRGRVLYVTFPGITVRVENLDGKRFKVATWEAVSDADGTAGTHTA